MPKISIIFCILMIIATTIGLIISKDWNYIIVIIFFMFIITTIVSINLFANINGVYENGLIFYKYIAWEKIHSYKWINNDTISFLFNNGNRVDFNNITNKEKIMELIINNKIEENNN
jgi:hypothetical protein